MDIRVGDILTCRKQHPCGCDRFVVLRVGADLRVKCLGCGHEILTPRGKFEPRIKAIDRPQ